MASMQWDWGDVTIVMAGSSPSEPVQSALTPCPSPGYGRGEPAAQGAEPAAQPAFPPLTTQAANLFQAAVAFVGDGCALVDDAEYRCRLEICRACDRRAGKRCTACGCWIGLKARGRAFACPLGRWEQQGR